MRLKLSAAVLVLALVACTGKKTINVSPTYVDADATMSTVAILPVMSAEGLEGVRRTINESLYEAFRVARPDLTFIAADVTLDRLNEQDLADEYSAMMESYERTGIMSKATLEEMASAIGADALLASSARYWERSLTEDFIQNLEMVVRVWSPEEGDVIFEAAGTVEKPVNDEIEDRLPLDELVRDAANAVAAQLPNARPMPDAG